jgi:hypothetical protein
MLLAYSNACAAALLFASELHVDSAVFIKHALEPVVVNICGHRILQDKSGEDPGNGQKLPSKWSSLELLKWSYCQRHFNNGYSEFEHGRPAFEREQQ